MLLILQLHRIRRLRCEMTTSFCTQLPQQQQLHSSSAQAQQRPPEQHPQRSATAPQQRSHYDQLVQTAYSAVGIDKNLYKEAGRPSQRVRQHANPLRLDLQVPVGPLKWGVVYEEPSRPLVLDVGSGYGRFLLALAAAMPGHNALGLEIREPLVGRGNRWAERLGLSRRAHFVMANATVSALHMLPSYPGGVDLVTIQFPDPHFKKKHRKRRMVQPELVTAIAGVMRPGARLLLQSDVLPVVEDMRNQFESFAGDEFELAGEHLTGAVSRGASELGERGGSGGGSGAGGRQSRWAAGGWLAANPLGVPTERELHVLAQGLPVYRMLLVKREALVA